MSDHDAERLADGFYWVEDSMLRRSIVHVQGHRFRALDRDGSMHVHDIHRHFTVLTKIKPPA
jgi:hypothetical protein